MKDPRDANPSVAAAVEAQEEAQAEALCNSLVASYQRKEDGMFDFAVRAWARGPLIATVSLRPNEAGTLESWGSSLDMWCAISDYAERHYTMDSTAMADRFAEAVIEACNAARPS